MTSIRPTFFSLKKSKNRLTWAKEILKHLQFDSGSVATWHRWVEQTVQLVPAWEADELGFQTKAAE
jgi:hypothetical protein